MPKTTKRKTKPALKRSDKNTDYVLETDSVSIAIKGFSVYLQKTDEGMNVDIFPLNLPDNTASESIASTYALDSEVEFDPGICSMCHVFGEPCDKHGGPI